MNYTITENEKRIRRAKAEELSRDIQRTLYSARHIFANASVQDWLRWSDRHAIYWNVYDAVSYIADCHIAWYEYNLALPISQALGINLDFPKALVKYQKYFKIVTHLKSNYGQGLEWVFDFYNYKSPCSQALRLFCTTPTISQKLRDQVLCKIRSTIRTLWGIHSKYLLTHCVRSSIRLQLNNNLTQRTALDSGRTLDLISKTKLEPFELLTLFRSNISKEMKKGGASTIKTFISQNPKCKKSFF